MSRVPYVIEKGEKDQERVYDLFSRLLKDRIIFITGEFTSSLADTVVAQLLFLEANDSEKDICIYVNSIGGSVSAMYAIYDTMNYIKPDIVTVGYGQIMSAGTFILAAGTKSKRHVLPNSEIMIHELSGHSGGKFGDMQVTYKHIERLYAKMARDYSDMTGQTIKKIQADMERDFYMTAEEARDYGLIDHVAYKRI